ncbi:HlyD family type I secretion periplasmic adaptor subunit (plasmid) [Ensifer adhaerens]|uniref:HlyD family type I secretion periplasmic adaptor subunit n=1 Tax=Ensifer adhaerens TaxID=106592 RepID=UPI001CBD291D|nr:HlyD family type I secretion periplasmic adaptor subunit [Ensifer adhaerens]MBZ7927693.1 HlyD family type I secretion periplasmic adaptor subunit [Ensifer adhaerens]UAX98088.1 HlyD family type I secretion periplasmic adaptor subunit [Ensifer adhaerens]UAY05469.1 HlyD family type I secretion periplasmic adaptor subunit [Ensifer adhaerens]UAY12847.1 HlyD family type I secretion periplasmic adaptor subunit [Ensifer adhaerens]
MDASVAGITWDEFRPQFWLDAAKAGHGKLIAVTGSFLTQAGIELNETTILLLIWSTIAVASFGLFRFYQSIASHQSEPPARTLANLTRSPRRLGIAAMSLFAIVFVGWSLAAPLATAALAPGIVSPDGYRKTVQHLEGGIVRSIHIREGDVVKAGDPLITLDDTKAKALNSEVRERLLHVLATEARLEAERTGSAEISFPHFLVDNASGDLERLMEGQRQLLLSRRAAHQGRTQILDARIRQLQEQNGGLQEVIAAEVEQIGLIDEEISAAQVLVEKHLERKPRILALKRERANIAAAKASNRAKIAENAQAVGEAKLQLLTIVEERQEKISGELAETRRLKAELSGQLPSREDILKRTVIRAPLAGIVMNLQARSESGVIEPGQPLLDIVPSNSGVVIDAKVRPIDIERITPGMRARVILTAYKQRSLPLIHGKLRSISADAMTDERTGVTYFLAKVEVDQHDLANLRDVQVLPGMPAEVMLMDGEQSLAAYLLAPILDSSRRGLLEN